MNKLVTINQQKPSVFERRLAFAIVVGLAWYIGLYVAYKAITVKKFTNLDRLDRTSLSLLGSILFSVSLATFYNVFVLDLILYIFIISVPVNGIYAFFVFDKHKQTNELQA